MTDAERIAELEGQVAALRSAMEWITECWGSPADEYCRADMEGAIEAGREALSTDAGKRETAVIQAAKDYVDQYRDDSYMGGKNPFDKLCDAVDALEANP